MGLGMSTNESRLLDRLSRRLLHRCRSNPSSAAFDSGRLQRLSRAQHPLSAGFPRDALIDFMRTTTSPPIRWGQQDQGPGVMTIPGKLYSCVGDVLDRGRAALRSRPAATGYDAVCLTQAVFAGPGDLRLHGCGFNATWLQTIRAETQFRATLIIIVSGVVNRRDQRLAFERGGLTNREKTVQY